MQTKRLIPLLALCISLTACAAANKSTVIPAPPAASAAVTVSQPTTQPLPSSTAMLPTKTTAAPQPVLTPVLEWQGSVQWGDSDASKCKSLQVDAKHQMTLGYCGQPPAVTQAVRQEFTEMEARLAPFQIKTDQETLVFRGQGTLDSPAWQRAVLAWTHWTFAENFSGHICASCRTVVSWFFGQVPGQADLCTHLTVLDYGYAYAETVPCKGGTVQKQSGGWIDTASWEQLDNWLYSRTNVYKDDNYFLGTGAQEMSDSEVTQLAQWAQGVYDRLAKP